MAQKASTATNAREFTVIDYDKPCRRCGNMAGREYDNHYECTRCGNTISKSDVGVQTTFTHDDTDKTWEATQAEVEKSIGEVESQFEF